MISLLIRIAASGYGLLASVFFLVLCFLQYLGYYMGAIVDIIVPFALVNAVLFLVISATRHEGRFSWVPLASGSKILHRIFAIALSLILINLAGNLVMLFYKVKLATTPASDALREAYLLQNLFSLMAIMSLLVCISFTVGLKNVVPRCIVEFVDCPLSIFYKRKH